MAALIGVRESRAAMKMLAEYLDTKFEQMAAQENDPKLKAELERQAARPVMEAPRLRAAFGALPRFNSVALRPRDLPRSLLPPERRFIAFPKAYGKAL
jgi:hypothetical protein